MNYRMIYRPCNDLTDTSSVVIRLDRGARDILYINRRIRSSLNVLNIETTQHLKGQR